MNPCDMYERSIERMLADEIDHAERDRLLAHSERCAACREYVDLHYQLLEPDLETATPTDHELATMRGEVLREIQGRQRAGEKPSKAAVRELLRGVFRRPALAGGFTAVAVLLLGAGAVLGVQWGGQPIVVSGVDLDRLSAEARSNRDLSDVQNARYLYSNVGFSELPDGRLALSFDVTRHMEVARLPDDPLVNEILTQSLLRTSSVGTRLDAMDYAGSLMEPKIQQAMILAMLDDPSQAVRLRALEILSEHHDDPDVQSGLLAVLRSENSVQMRLLAMDALVASPTATGRLEQALGEMEFQRDPALFVRAAGHGLEPPLLQATDPR